MLMLDYQPVYLFAVSMNLICYLKKLWIKLPGTVRYEHENSISGDERDNRILLFVFSFYFDCLSLIRLGPKRGCIGH
jgi:hypothetical protein